MNKKPTHLDDRNIVLGAILGFIMGSIIWLFYLPRRGEETREQISNTAKKLGGQKPDDTSHTQGKAVPEQTTKKYEYFR